MLFIRLSRAHQNSIHVYLKQGETFASGRQLTSLLHFITEFNLT